MGISYYPRFGHPIAPATLREILDTPVPDPLIRSGHGTPVRLSDLDETCWLRWPTKVCENLAGAVVGRVRSAVASLPNHLRRTPLPPPAGGISLADLELEPRTLNCLTGAGFGERPHRLASATLEDVLGIRSFGAKCLVDLLTSLESCRYAPVPPKPVGLPDEAAVSNQLSPSLGPDPGDGLQPALQARVEARVSASRHILQEVRDHLDALSRVPHPESLRRDDPRLGHLLTRAQARARTLRELVDDLVACLEGIPDPDALLARLEEVRKDTASFYSATTRLAGMRVNLRELREAVTKAQALTLEGEAVDILQAAAKKRVSDAHMRLIRRRIGLEGGGGARLTTIARELGVSRERVSQICRALVRDLKYKRPFAPILEQALRLISEQLPAGATETESKIAAHGLSDGALPLEAISNLAGLFGRKAGFSVATGGTKRFAVGPSFQRLPGLIVRVAKRSVQRFGVATLDDVAAQVAEHVRGVASAALTGLAKEVLGNHEGLQWLDSEGRWFWVSSVQRNRLLNQIRKIVSVAPRVHVSELREGVRRHPRMQGFAPPRVVLLELCRRVRGYRVEGDWIVGDPHPDWRKVLGRVEQALVSVLEEHGPLMDRAKLEAHCLGRGMKKSTFYVSLDTSPVIARFARGVYGLRGAPVPPGLVDSLIPKPRRGRVLLDYGWTPDRKVWLEFKLSTAMISTGVCTVPAAMRRFLQGRFDLKTGDGSRVGTLASKASSAWGLLPFFARRGGEPGDHFLIVFDLAARIATASIRDAATHLEGAAPPGAASADRTSPR
jgi:hypothetical protein